MHAFVKCRTGQHARLGRFDKCVIQSSVIHVARADCQVDPRAAVLRLGTWSEKSKRKAIGENAVL